MRIQLLNLRKILRKPFTLVEVEVEVKVKEDKEVVEVEIPTKASNKIMSLMNQIEAHMEEETLKAGGTRENTKIIREVMWMQTIVVAGHVVKHTTLKETAHGKIREIGSNKIIMHPAAIRTIQRGYLLCNT